MICNLFSIVVIIFLVVIYLYSFYFVYLYFFKYDVFQEKLNNNAKFGQKIINFILTNLPFLDYRKIKNKILRFLVGFALWIPWFSIVLTATVFLIVGTGFVIGGVSDKFCS